MVLVGSGLRDQVDRGTFGTAIGCREALRADHEFLHGFEGELHHRPANRVVFVIDTVDGYVHVAPALSINGKNRIAVFRGVVRIRSFYAGR